MKKTRKKYDKEFKQKAIELSNLRGSVAEIAEELYPSYQPQGSYSGLKF